MDPQYCLPANTACSLSVFHQIIKLFHFVQMSQMNICLAAIYIKKHRGYYTSRVNVFIYIFSIAQANKNKIWIDQFVLFWSICAACCCFKRDTSIVDNNGSVLLTAAHRYSSSKSRGAMVAKE